jgi:cytochrome c
MFFPIAYSCQIRLRQLKRGTIFAPPKQPNTLKRFFFLIPAVLLGWGAVRAQAPAAKRPVELWAFRSVLDGTPRMLTLALHSDLYVAYDTYHCGLAKVWKEGVLKLGAVYNQKHGPQPLTVGGKYLDQPLTEAAFFVQQGTAATSQPKRAKVRFKGYRFSAGKVALKYEIELDSLKKASLEEWPEFVDGVSGPKLERHFTWVQAPPPDFQVFAEILVDGLASPQSLSTQAPFSVLSRTEKFMPGNRSVWKIQGLLKLSPDVSTQIHCFFDPATLR